MFKRKSKGDRIFDCFNYAFVSLLLIITIYPLYLIVIASFSDPTMVNMGKVWLYPRGFSLGGYAEIFKNIDIWIGYRNTLFYTVVATFINLSLTIAGGYALSRKDLPYRNGFMLLFAFTMYFKGGLIPSYLLVKQLSMLNTVWAMMIPNALSVYNLIIARTFFQSNLPDELLEAGKIDGCNDFKFFFAIALPLSKAVIAVLTLYYAVGHWNAYFNALIYLTDRSLFPLQLFLREILVQSELLLQMMQESGGASNRADYAEMIKYGVIIVSSLPVLILYPLVQKYFMKGVMIGAIKG